MSVSQLPIDVPFSEADLATIPNLTEVLSTEDSLVHWWTFVRPAFAGGVASGEITPRKGSVKMTPQAELAFETAYPDAKKPEGYEFVYLSGNKSGGTTNQYCSAAIPAFTGPFTVLSMQRFNANNVEPWSLFFAPAVPPEAVPRLGVQPRASGSARLASAFNAASNQSLTLGEGQPVTGAVVPLITVIDPVNWTVKQAVGSGTPTTDTATGMVGLTLPSTWTLRVGCYLTSEPFTGLFTDMMILTGDLFANEPLKAKLLAYAAEQYS